MPVKARDIGRNFSPLQVGYIADCIEPLNAGSSAEWALELTSEVADIEVIPIERDGAVLGVVSRKELETLTESAWKRFWQKDLDAYLIPPRGTIEASTYIGHMVDEVLSKKSDPGSDWYIVQHRHSYLGIVSVRAIMAYMNTIRAQDLKQASEIQQFLLARSKLSDKRISAVFYNQMAHEIGGDFYNVVKMSPHRYLIACLDVSGKNISGALATMVLGACFSSLEIFKYQGSPRETSEIINQMVKNVSPPGIFVSAILFYVDFSAMSVEIHNCGLSPVFVFMPQDDKKMSYRVISPNLPPLGVKDEMEPDTEHIIPITAGLRLAAYSDGLTDMSNIFGERYGEEQAQELIKAIQKLPSQKIASHVARVVKDWIGEASLSDDITLTDIRFS